MASFDEVALPLAKPRRERIAKQKATLGTDDYVVYVTNPRQRPLPRLLTDNEVETPYGDDLIALLQSYGYEAHIKFEYNDDYEGDNE